MGVLTNNCTDKSRVEVPDQTFHQGRPSLPLQLLSPADNESPAELGSASKYLSSESSNPIDERSPSSSPPVTKKLFPLHSTMELVKYTQVSECQEDNATVELSTSHGGSVPLELFKESEMRVENGAVQSVLHRTHYKSSSLDHSPSSSNSDAQVTYILTIHLPVFTTFPSCLHICSDVDNRIELGESLLSSLARIRAVFQIHFVLRLCKTLFSILSLKHASINMHFVISFIAGTEFAFKQSIGYGELHSAWLCCSINLCVNAIGCMGRSQWLILLRIICFLCFSSAFQYSKCVGCSLKMIFFSVSLH